jgi:hypothetical protein
VKRVTVTAAAISAMIVKNTKASARLEGREVPEGHVRSPAVERYIAEQASRVIETAVPRRTPRVDVATEAGGTVPQASHPFDEVIGPFYDSHGLTGWLQISRQMLRQRVRAGMVLGCPVDDGSLGYPAWQFDDSGAILPGLAEVLVTLNAGAGGDSWQIALWLSAPNEELSGMSARDWLRNNQSRALVLDLAKRTAIGWSQ